MAELKLTQARNKQGEWVDIKDIPLAQKGFGCGCVCPKCGEEVGAWIEYRPSTLRKTPIPHFKHKPKTDCKGAQMTALHQMTQEVLAEYKKMMIPDYKGEYYSAPARWMKFNEVVLEKTVDIDDEHQRRPDCIGYTESTELWVEVYVAHKVDAQKANEIKSHGIACVEVDMRSLLKKPFNKEIIRDFLENEEGHREWINPLPDCREKEEQERQRMQWLLDEEERVAQQREQEREQERERLWKQAEEVFLSPSPELSPVAADRLWNYWDLIIHMRDGYKDSLYEYIDKWDIVSWLKNPATHTDGYMYFLTHVFFTLQFTNRPIWTGKGVDIESIIQPFVEHRGNLSEGQRYGLEMCYQVLFLIMGFQNKDEKKRRACVECLIDRYRYSYLADIFSALCGHVLMQYQCDSMDDVIKHAHTGEPLIYLAFVRALKFGPLKESYNPPEKKVDIRNLFVSEEEEALYSLLNSYDPEHFIFEDITLLREQIDKGRKEVQEAIHSSRSRLSRQQGYYKGGVWHPHKRL